MTVRILAVEDSPTQAAALHAALESGGYSVTEARSGEIALEALASGTFDVVVSDVVMPGSVDGYELCRRVKAAHPSIPVILLTSLSDPLDIIRGLEAGADNFLTKPYTPEHLLERIALLRANRRSRTRNRIQAGVIVQFMDREFVITSEREQILDLLISTFEDAVRQNRELRFREEEVLHSRERLAGMYEIAVALNQCTTEEEVVAAALDGAVRLPRVRAAWISLREGESGFRLGGARNMPVALSESGALEGDCRCRHMLLAGELDRVTNIVECERIARAGTALDGVRYHASVPLHSGGRTLGILNLLSEAERHFDEDDRAILYGIGNQVGFAIERARMRADLEARVEERTRELTASEERFRTLVTEVNDGFFVTDAQGIIAFANRALAAIHGVESPAALEGRTYEEYLRPEAVAELRAAVRAALEDGAAPPLVTAPVLRPDGTEAVVEVRATPVVQGRQLAGTRGVVRDVTERERLKEQFLQAQKMEVVGRLAGGIAHDFNNILTSILITTELLLQDLTDDDPAKADLQTIRGSANRAAALTQQLLAFSRKQMLTPKVVRLNDLIEGIEPMFRPLLGADVTCELLLSPDLGNTEIDPGKMEQVIMNLVVNARDAMPRGGRIVLETRNVELNGEYVRTHPEARPGPYVVLTVTDDGEGIAPHILERVFEPFFTTKGAGKGTGLGLATVHGIVNQSGGHIWVYSEPGSGTTFKIYLPRVQAETDARGLPAPRVFEADGIGIILLVEDDDAVRHATERVLRRAGYEVIAVEGGAQALAAVESQEGSFDLLITDVVMPGMTGPELAQRLRRDRPGFRLLFMSGYTDEVIARQGLFEPGQPYLEKPFVADDLLNRVREVLDDPEPAAPPRLDPNRE